MPSFDSPITNKKFSATHSMKEVDVPDESDSNGPDIEAMRAFQEKMKAQQLQYKQSFTEEKDLSEIEKEIRVAREMKRTGKERLSDPARRRIEMLIGMTRTTHSVDIDGNSFTFQSLKSKELREAIVEASQFDGTVESPFEIRKQLLARSLIEISGVEIDQFIGSSKLEDRLIFIEELDEALLNRLYDEYLKLATEARNKYSIKSEAEAKEVIEDLKK